MMEQALNIEKARIDIQEADVIIGVYGIDSAYGKLAQQKRLVAQMIIAGDGDISSALKIENARIDIATAEAIIALHGENSQQGAIAKQAMIVARLTIAENGGNM